MTVLLMCLDPPIQQVVEIVLGILPTKATTPDAVLDLIGNYVRGKRNAALDRVAFEERRQGPAESFDDFYISLRRLADAADLCGACIDSRMATRIMAGIHDSETKKKLLAISPFRRRRQQSTYAEARSLPGPMKKSSALRKVYLPFKPNRATGIRRRMRIPAAHADDHSTLLAKSAQPLETCAIFAASQIISLPNAPQNLAN
jgi:hypothetical protein